MTPVKLTVDEVRKTAREYYDKKLLTAQVPKQEMRACRNELEFGDTKYRCAVAASFPDNWEHMHNFDKIESGVERGYVTVESAVELARLVRIQQTHDTWADASAYYGDDNPLVKKLENSFLYNIKHTAYVY